VAQAAALDQSDQGTNGEGVGVEPDIAALADKAFDLAYQDALDKTALA
jgi:hypothetical protein